MSMTRTEGEVLAANDEFYRAFAARDLEAMESLWARRAPVACVHPGWKALRGREQVLSSWAAILGGPAPPAISCPAATVHLLGEVAFVVCTEHIPPASFLAATNVFVREDGHWRLVHHHAGGIASSAQDDGEPPSGTMH